LVFLAVGATVSAESELRFSPEAMASGDTTVSDVELLEVGESAAASPAPPTSTEARQEAEMAKLMADSIAARNAEGVKITDEKEAYRKNETAAAVVLNEKRIELQAAYAQKILEQRIVLLQPYLKQAATKVAQSYQLAAAQKEAKKLLQKKKQHGLKIKEETLDKVKIATNNMRNASMEESISKFMDAVVEAAKSPQEAPVDVNATKEVKAAAKAAPKKTVVSSMLDSTEESLLSEAEDSAALPKEKATILEPKAGGAADLAKDAVNGRPEGAPKKGSKEEEKAMKEMVQGAFAVVAGKGEKASSFLGPPLAAPDAGSVTGTYQMYWAAKDQIAKKAGAQAKKAVDQAKATAKKVKAESGDKSGAYEAATQKVREVQAIAANVGRSKSDALRAVDAVRAEYAKVVKSKGDKSAEAMYAKRNMDAMEKSLAKLNGENAFAEPKTVKQAKRAIEIIEAKRLYSELRHRERFMWDKDIDSKTDMYVKEVMAAERNATLAAFYDELKERLELNSTQIAAKVALQLQQAGLAPTSERGTIMRQQWTWTYRYMNITNSTAFDGKLNLKGILENKLDTDLAPIYRNAYRPWQKWLFDQEARKRCRSQATQVMSVRMAEEGLARSNAAKAKQDAKNKLDATLGARANLMRIQVNQRVQKMWQAINAKGPAKLKKDFKFAMDNKVKADLAVQRKEDGALGVAGNADKELQKQIDLAAVSFTDAKDADLMTAMKLEINQIKNPPAKAGEFGNGR